MLQGTIRILRTDAICTSPVYGKIFGSCSPHRYDRLSEHHRRLLAQSGLVWVFIITVGCAGMSNWLGELMIPMASKKTAQEPTGPKRYTDDQLRRAIDETIAAHGSKQGSS